MSKTFDKWISGIQTFVGVLTLIALVQTCQSLDLTRKQLAISIEPELELLQLNHELKVRNVGPAAIAEIKIIGRFSAAYNTTAGAIEKDSIQVGGGFPSRLAESLDGGKEITVNLTENLVPVSKPLQQKWVEVQGFVMRFRRKEDLKAFYRPYYFLRVSGDKFGNPGVVSFFPPSAKFGLSSSGVNDDGSFPALKRSVSSIFESEFDVSWE